jgi:hypothetical protein
MASSILGYVKVVMGERVEESSYQSHRATVEQVLSERPALPLLPHTSLPNVPGMPFSNPNKTPGEKVILWLVLFSIPWIICQQGDPSTRFKKKIL